MAQSTAHESAVKIILEQHGIHPEVRNSDALDFHDLSVATLHKMLEQAFNAGFVNGAREVSPALAAELHAKVGG